MKRSLPFLTVSALITLLPLSSQADTFANRLDRIQQTGVLVAGYRETSVPFSYLSPDQPVGFGVAMTKRVATAIQHKLQMPALELRWNAATLSTRIPLVTTGTLDILCATDTHTKARESQVAFSSTFYVSESGALVAANSTISQLSDLQGKRVAVPAASTMETLFTQMQQEQGLNVDLIKTQTNRAALQLVRDGQADAYINSMAIMAGEALKEGNTGSYKMINLGLNPEAFGCMLPANEPELKQLVDATLSEMMQSGELEQIYNQWFNNPIAPFGRAMNLPLNDKTRAVYAIPNDQPLQ
ncbi:MAG: amino acid ABC transporter substrate-binding protein [Pseudomonadaceae bacterium]